MSKAKQLITIREAGERFGRTDSAIRAWYKQGRVRGKKVNNRIMLELGDLETIVAKIDARPQGRKPKSGRPKEPRRAEEEMSLPEFAKRAGLNQRTVNLKRARGDIGRYTETELEKVIAKREAGQMTDFDPATADAEALANATQEELKRFKLYQEARSARIKADRDEGKVYDAARVEAVMRRLAHAAKSSWQQVSMLLPGQLADKGVEEVRAILARYAQQQITTLIEVEASNMAGSEE